MANGQWPMASEQRWPLVGMVTNGGQWRPHWSLIVACLVPSWRLQFLVQCCLHFLNYQLINCKWQVAIVASVANVACVADVADVVCVTTVTIASARKCQCHRNDHHDEYE